MYICVTSAYQIGKTTKNYLFCISVFCIQHQPLNKLWFAERISVNSCISSSCTEGKPFHCLMPPLTSSKAISSQLSFQPSCVESTGGMSYNMRKSERLCAETQCGLNALPQNITTQNISRISVHARNQVSDSEKTHCGTADAGGVLEFLRVNDSVSKAVEESAASILKHINRLCHKIRASPLTFLGSCFPRV